MSSSHSKKIHLSKQESQLKAFLDLGGQFNNTIKEGITAIVEKASLVEKSSHIQAEMYTILSEDKKKLIIPLIQVFLTLLYKWL